MGHVCVHQTEGKKELHRRVNKCSWGDIVVWHQQLADLANLWEKKKQSVSIGATKEVEKEAGTGRGEEKARQREWRP